MSSDLSDDDRPLGLPSNISHVRTNGVGNGHAYDEDVSMSEDDDIPLVCFQEATATIYTNSSDPCVSVPVYSRQVCVRYARHTRPKEAQETRLRLVQR